MFAIFNLGLLSIEILLLIAWLIQPSDNYVVALVINGIFLICMESFRRFLRKNRK